MSLLNLVPKPDGSNHRIKHDNEEVERDTIPLIKKVIRETLHQTKKLSEKLKGSTLEETLRNDTNFILKYIRYKKDEDGVEQVREPSRLIWDAQGDCDCFVVTLSSLLTNQKIPHSLKIISQSRGSERPWTHIYVIVPKPEGGYYTLDPVTNKFDFEAKATEKKTIPMALERLSGLADCKPGSNTLVGKLAEYIPTAQVESEGLVPTRKFLVDNDIAFTESVDPETKQTTLLIPTSIGTISAATIITPKEASQVKQAALPKEPELVQAEVITEEQPKQMQAGFNLFGLLALMGIGIALLSGGDEKKAMTNAVTPGLAGTKKIKPKKKTAKRKLKTLRM